LRSLSLIPLILAVTLSPHLHADTFNFVYLDSDSRTPVGLTAAGDVVIFSGSPCQENVGTSPHCYITYHQGVAVSRTDEIPSNLVFDNGTPCAISAPGFFISLSRCNGDRYAFSATFDRPNNQFGIGLFEGGGNITGFVRIGGESDTVLLLNSLGDVVSIDGQRGSDYEVFNLTSRASMTPEPSTLALLGSGLLSLAGFARKLS